MAEWTLNLMNSLGYLGIVLLMILENLFPPLPSELILPAAGFAAARGDLNLPGVVLSGALGSVLGTLPLYYIGRAVGEERLVGWADRYGKWLTLRGKDIRQADDWFDRHGPKAVLFGRLVPAVRTLISVPAGIAEMSLPRYLAYSAIGSLIWACLLAGAGYLLEAQYDTVARYLDPVSKAIVGFLTAKWRRELDYVLRKSLWSHTDDRIAVRFQYEWHDAEGRWFRSYGNELWEFDADGLMRRRQHQRHADRRGRPPPVRPAPRRRAHPGARAAPALTGGDGDPPLRSGPWTPWTSAAPACAPPGSCWAP